MRVQREVARRMAALQVYIHIRKGVNVQIAPPRNGRELNLLIVMAETADQWMAEQGYQSKLI